ncbi:MAG: DNA replication and repair protein RecF, partial [Clostridia bacterium]|nr:DNA replication and repair protein RecF [Clostridia bacterium]
YEDLRVSIDKDLRLGYTTIGPHRDDIKFTLNGMDARIFGSQGQQRTVALALKLAETETFKKRFGEYPVLILDDVLSELDKTRQRKLIADVEKMQTVFTATGIDRTVFKGKQVKKFTVENGKIK